MAVQCAVNGCFNGRYRLSKWTQQKCPHHQCFQGTDQCVCAPPFILYPFPTQRKDPHNRRIWIKNIYRKDEKTAKNWSPKKYDRVCSVHFVDGKPTKDHPYPELLLGKGNTNIPTRRCRRTVIRQPVIKQHKDYQQHAATKPFAGQEAHSSHQVISMDTETEPEPMRVSELPHMVDHNYDSFELQCDCQSCDHCIACHNKLLCIKESQQSLKNKLANKNSFSSLLVTDSDVSFYTGLPSKAIFDHVFAYVSSKTDVINYWRGTKHSVSVDEKQSRKKSSRGPQRKLKKKDEFFLTLLKLKQGLLNQFLADMFQVSQSLISSIFTTWIKIISCTLKESIQMPPPDFIIPNLSSTFRNKHNRIRGILDCTEFFIERPKDLHLQAVTWSDYKKHNTIKVLIVITPRGRIGFVSEAWGGRASDRHIVLNSGFLATVEPHDLYMADRGFAIADDLLLHKAELVIPPGASGKKQMTAKDVEKTKVVANLRIHVERAIERIKRFRLLKYTLPISLLPLADDIIQACAGLCNLLDPLVR